MIADAIGPFGRGSSTGEIRYETELGQIADPPQEGGVEAWVALGSPLLLLAVAALVARWYLRRGSVQATPRWLRILAAAAAFSGAITMLLLIEQLRLGNSAPEVAVRVIVAFAALLLIGVIIAGVADLLLSLFHPQRSRRWFAIASACYVPLVASYLVILAWIDGNFAQLDVLAFLQLGFIALVVSLAWWTCLPAPRQDMSRVFD